MDQRLGSSSPGEARRKGRETAGMRCPAKRAVVAAVKAGATAYDRARDLPALIRSDPFAPPPDNAEGVAAIVARLERALRAERNRARSDHWTYDLNRHIALAQAHRAEQEFLAELKTTAP